jgi:FtsH-binding integral membrane protein
MSQDDVQIIREPRNGFGITALVLALVGVVFGLIPLTGFIAVILGALAILFGLLGLGRARRGAASNKKMSIIASGLGIGVLALGIWGVVLFFQAVDKIDGELTDTEQKLNEVIEENCQELEKQFAESGVEYDC